jgi:VanZ family protein
LILQRRSRTRGTPTFGWADSAAATGLLLLFPFFFIGGPGYHSSRIYKAGWDLGHVLFFMLATWLIFHVLRPSMFSLRSFWIYTRVFFLVAILGVSVELLQMILTSRRPDVLDLLRNQLGCLLVFAFMHPSSGRKSRLVVLSRIGLMLLFLLALVPMFRAVADQWCADRQFPFLADFETPFEVDRWVHPKQVQRERGLARNGDFSMRVRLSTATYSGTSLFYFPKDWSGFHALHFSVFWPGSKVLQLHCRIHDRLHKANNKGYRDRFNRHFFLRQGWNDLVVPLSAVAAAPKDRTMDMHNIAGFGIFVVQQPRPLTIYVDHVYLE